MNLEISFIIIGRNEGWKISKCIQSIFLTIKDNSLTEYEIIYIDSFSSDDSIERVKKFKKIKIFKLTNIYNAAIARNLGANKSKGNILYFIDGDMEIYPKFLSIVYSKAQGLNHPFISGQVYNFNYNEEGILLNNTWQYNGILKEDKYFSTTGGVFIIYRELWERVSGMDIRFRRGQDLDFALTLSK